MLTQPLFEKLEQLRFFGMLKALQEQMQMPDIGDLSFEERLGLLLDRETTEREKPAPQNPFEKSQAQAKRVCGRRRLPSSKKARQNPVHAPRPLNFS